MTTRYYTSYEQVPKEYWRWPNFSPAEIACRGSGDIKIDEEAMDALQALRTKLNKPMIITSAYRSPSHNKRVGGAAKSKHLLGTAFDVRMDNHNPDIFYDCAKSCGFKGFGFYPDRGFIHIDLGPPRQWGKSFSEKQEFSKEPEPKSLTKSRTMIGAATAGGATFANAIIEGAQQYLPDAAQAATTAKPFIPDFVPWIFGAIAIAGIIVVLYARRDDRNNTGVVDD